MRRLLWELIYVQAIVAAIVIVPALVFWGLVYATEVIV